MASCKPKRSAAKGDAPAAAAQPSNDVADIDPKLEWHDAATGYVIRLALPGNLPWPFVYLQCVTRHHEIHVICVPRMNEGFKKEEFKVQVDAGGRLTVRGERPAGYVRFHKAFQLPPTANVDAVAGRFDGSVLSLTVPKKPQGAAEMVVSGMAEAECAAAAVVAREKEEAAAAVG
ncbi:hypothetical protein PR202_ga10673 [Eleusine coracana subsp. coracana]|uniref:SHSP domain-containing protein n=1 Tax=Eleusine coracana subsp. coracana TaxID=191504 RepID=A0AAV5C7A7_ELECO|nr:hypothetical protein PR202_ga10673 [Eleusine coracana subsp. coracana]